MHATRFLRALGPGVVTGAADDDPSGIATYSISGATAGYTQLWAALITTPMMAVLMGMCARIGLVSGAGLVRVLKETFDRRLIFALVVLTVAANTLNIGADFGGMAASMSLIVPMPEIVWIAIFGAVIFAVEIYASYRVFARVVEILCLSLLAYVITAFIVNPPWMTVFYALVIPQFQWNAAWMTTFLAVLGTTITPYLFIWQGSMYNEEVRAHRHESTIRDAHADINAGMIYSNAMTFFVIVTTAATLGAQHLPIATAEQAAAALRPLAGNFASAVFAMGIVGTGLLAIPVIAGSSAYALADYFRWEASLDDKPRQAPAFYTVVVLGLVCGVAMAALHLDAMKMLLYSAAFNGIAVVPLIYFVLRTASMPEIMGRWTASRAARIVGWAAFVLMALASLATVYSWLAGARA